MLCRCAYLPTLGKREDRRGPVVSLITNISIETLQGHKAASKKKNNDRRILQKSILEVYSVQIGYICHDMSLESW